MNQQVKHDRLSPNIASLVRLSPNKSGEGEEPAASAVGSPNKFGEGEVESFRLHMDREPAASAVGSQGRHGVTLIEVVFAIGVILIGMVGLMSILPLAGYRAQDAIDFSVGAAVADSVADEILARGWIGENMPAGKTQPFCIDPMLMANNGITAKRSYNASVFPMYVANHDPLLNPSVAAATSTAGFAGQPRMTRVGLNVFSTYTDLTKRQELARTLVERDDDLNFVRPKDRSAAPAIIGLTATSGGVKFGRAVPTGEYSWIATVDPDADGRYASMSVVVLRNRDRVDVFPEDDETSAVANVSSERVAYATNGIGFSGGAGGRVTLYSSGNTVSKLRSNDWIMLSRTLPPPPATASQRQVHRWYRVLSTDGEAEMLKPTSDTVIDGVTIPTATSRTSTDVWKRTVMLSGPDWSFDTSVPAGATSNFATYATIMDNVVSVTERTISLADF